MRPWVYKLGVLAPPLFAGAVAVLGWLKPGYNHIYYTISELGETGSLTALPAAIIFIVIGLMITVFGYGVHLRLKRPDKRVWTGVMIMLYGVLDFVGSGVFPVESGGTATTLVSMIHVYSTLIGELAALGMPVWFVKDTIGFGEWKSHRRFSRGVFYLSLPLMLFLVYCIVENTPGVMDVPIGLAQRLLVGLFLSWIMFTGYRLIQGGARA